MSKKDTTKKADAEAEGAEVHYRFSLKLEPVCYVGDKYTPELAETAEAKLAAAYDALVKVEALFSLLTLLDGREVAKAAGKYGDEFAMMLAEFGEVGRGLTQAAYTHIEEAQHELPE